MAVEERVNPAALAYKPEDYAYTVMWSEADQAYIGRVLEFPSLAAHGPSPVGALQEMTDVVRYVLEDLAEAGEEIPPPLSKRPFRGRLHLRMPEDLHHALVLQ